MKSRSKKSHPILTIIFSVIGIVVTHIICLICIHYPRESTFVILGIIAIALAFTKFKRSDSKPN